MKKLFFTFSLISISILTLAEDSKLHFGLKAAPSLAWLRTDTKGLDSDGSKFGFSYGLVTEFNFADNYAFATGLDITYRGGKFKTVETEYPDSSTTVTTSTNSSYIIQYVELPVTLKLKTNEIGYLTYYLQAGIAPGFKIRARGSYEAAIQTTTNGTTTNTSDKQSDIDIMKEINNFNLSMIIGGGIEYTLSGSTVLLTGIQFNNGFLDVFDSNDAKVNSNYLALTVAVLF
jgi:opacity protein-like surface antigen